MAPISFSSHFLISTLDKWRVCVERQLKESFVFNRHQHFFSFLPPNTFRIMISRRQWSSSCYELWLCDFIMGSKLFQQHKLKLFGTRILFSFSISFTRSFIVSFSSFFFMLRLQLTYSFTTRLFAQRKQHSTSSWNRMGQAKLSCCCLYAPCVLLSMKFRHFGACVPFLRETKSYKKKVSDFCILWINSHKFSTIESESVSSVRQIHSARNFHSCEQHGTTFVFSWAKLGNVPHWKGGTMSMTATTYYICCLN